jgi:LPS-assembly protein
MTRRWPVVLVLAACLLGGVALGCPAQAQAPGSVTLDAPGGEVTITADQMEQPGPNVLIARGNVELTRGTTRLLADRVEVNRDTGDAVALGRVIFYDGEDRLTGERIDYNIKTGTGVVHNGEARAAPYYRIAGQTMERLDESNYFVRRGVFTTCEDDPPSWSFRFGTANADLEDIIYGTNASIWVKGLPLLPWFPILGAAVRRERQSGFLFPTFGDSSRKGIFAEIPFFWAISDSQDLLMSLNYYHDRGVGLTGEYRYVLSPSAGGSVRAFGIFETSVPSNQLNTPGAATPGSTSTSAGFRTPAARGWWGIQHGWNVAPGLSFKTEINGVSDDLVLREYADSLYERSRQSVQSNVFLTKTWDSASLVNNVFWYQDLTTLRPVELNRLPDVRLWLFRQPVPGLRDLPGVAGRLNYELTSQLTNFVRQEGSEGVRFDFFPRVSLPVSVNGLFTVTPFAAPRLTAYSKTVTGRTTGSDGIVIESTKDEPIARQSIDLGLDFEARASRVYNLGGFGNVDAVLHSIEPRATYTWRDGSNLDVAKLPQWIDDNTPRASNVVFSLINRLRAKTVAPQGTDAHRWELMRFTVQSGYDFESTAQPVAPIRSELIIDQGRYLYFRGDTTYNVYNNEGFLSGNTDVGVVLPQVAASLGTRFTKGSSNFVQGTLRADITRYMSASFATNWDVRSDTFVENRFGIDFRFQCWAFDFAYIKRAKEQGLNSTDNEIRFAVYLLGVGGPFGIGQKFSAGPANVTGR